MKKIQEYFVLCLFFLSVNALFVSNPKWNHLAVQFPYYHSLPMTRGEAFEKGYKEIGNKAECSGEFEGFRFIKNDDPGVILMFDVNDYIAGIQTAFPEHEFTDPRVLEGVRKDTMYTRIRAHPEGQSIIYYVLTAYFVDPDIICSTGRSKEEFEESKVGTNLYIKNQTENILIPKHQKHIEDTDWTLGKCVPGMGLHYWYNVSKKMDCKTFRPFFLLYNNGHLDCVGIAIIGDQFKSSYYEHPPKLTFPLFLKEVPDCLKSDEVKGVSTMHVSFSGNLVVNTNCASYWFGI